MCWEAFSQWSIEITAPGKALWHSLYAASSAEVSASEDCRGPQMTKAVARLLGSSVLGSSLQGDGGGGGGSSGNGV